MARTIWYGTGVRPPHLMMAVASAAVLALGVYLFVEVRSAPAAAQVEVASRASAPAHKDPEPAKDDASPPAATPPVVRARDRHDPVPPPEEAPPAVTAVREKDQKADPNNDALMDEANKAYDKQEFDEARGIAQRVLTKEPDNIRMLRIMVSAACVETDVNEAAKWLAKLPSGDQAAMKTRCKRYGVTFPDAK